MDVGVEQTFLPQNFPAFPKSGWMTFGLWRAKMLS